MHKSSKVIWRVFLCVFDMNSLQIKCGKSHPELFNLPHDMWLLFDSVMSLSEEHTKKIHEIKYESAAHCSNHSILCVCVPDITVDIFPHADRTKSVHSHICYIQKPYTCMVFLFVCVASYNFPSQPHNLRSRGWSFVGEGGHNRRATVFRIEILLLCAVPWRRDMQPPHSKCTD